ncbi:MAG: ANTAR domain-containing response regulator [Methylovirgula sp.]
MYDSAYVGRHLPFSPGLPLKVLLADCNPTRSHALERALCASGTDEVVRVDAAEALPDAVQKHAPDLIIIDMDRADRDSIEGVRTVTSRQPHPVVMFVDQDDPVLMEEAIAAGVSSYNVVGTALPAVKPIVQAAVALFRHYQETESKLRKAEAGLKERAVIERAKGKLMQERHIAEPEAYHFLRRRAMDRGRRIVDIAAEILGDTSKSG